MRDEGDRPTPDWHGPEAPLPPTLGACSPDDVVGFDLDGTLVAGAPRGSGGWQDRLPIGERVASWAIQLARRGIRIVIITGRMTSQQHLTMEDLERIFGPLDQYRHPPTLIDEEDWSGWKTAAHRKAAHLKRLGCGVYVGDKDHLDGLAARLAGIEFIDVTKQS